MSVCWALFAIGFIVYITFFIIHKVYFKKQVKLMERYNAINQKFTSINLYKIEVIAKNNQVITSISGNLKKMQASYKEIENNCLTIYQNIETLKNEVSTMNLKPVKMHIQSIQNSLNVVEQDVQNILSQYNQYTQYGDTVAILFQSYRDLYDKLLAFYNDAFLYRENFTIINNLFAKISEMFIRVNQLSIKFDFKITYDTLKEMQNKFASLIQILAPVLKFQIVAWYLSTSFDKNEKIIRDSFNEINTQDWQIVNRLRKQFQQNYNSFIAAYKNLDLSTAYKRSIAACDDLNKINSFTTIHAKASSYINASLEEIKEQTSIILSNKQNIFDSIENIKQYFPSDENVVTTFDEIKQDIETIESQVIKSTNISSKSHNDKINALNVLCEISKIIYHKKNEISKKIDSINASLNKIIGSISDLNDLYVYFWQILANLKKLTPEDDEDNKILVGLIQNNLDLINSYTKEIIENPNPNYQLIQINLVNIIDNVNQFNEKLTKSITLKNYASKLMLYANRYREEAIWAPIFREAEAAFNSKKFDICIEKLLIICKKDKRKLPQAAPVSK